jgi:hypothetical protein
MSLIERLVVYARDVIGGIVATWQYDGGMESIRAYPLVFILCYGCGTWEVLQSGE